MSITAGGEEPVLSFVIVSYNTRRLLLGCIDSIFKSNPPQPFELIVCDNASADGSADAVKARFPDVTVLTSSVNEGFGLAANRGVAAAGGRYVAVMNPDTLLCEPAPRLLTNFLDRHPDVGAVGCRIVGPDGRPRTSCARFPTPLRTLCLFTRLDRLLRLPATSTYYGGRDWPHDHRRDVDTVLGAFFMMPSSVFREAGGFDRRYFMYYEEVDLFRSLREAGYRVVFLPEVSVVHFGAVATRQAYSAMRLEQQRSLLLYIRKWHGLPAAQATRLLLIVMAIGRLLRAAMTSRAGAAAAGDEPSPRQVSRTMLRGLLRRRLLESR